LGLKKTWGGFEKKGKKQGGPLTDIRKKKERGGTVNLHRPGPLLKQCKHALYQARGSVEKTA